jgi:ribosomal protein S18 acetylase RimI-like enzyme
MKKIVLNKIDYLVYRDGSGDTVEIYDIAVNSQRGVGIGSQLFDILKQKVTSKRIFALTRRENLNAQKYYEKNKFVGYVLPRFYPDGDAMIYIYERS